MLGVHYRFRAAGGRRRLQPLRPGWFKAQGSAWNLSERMPRLTFSAKDSAGKTATESAIFVLAFRDSLRDVYTTSVQCYVTELL